jgi:hypothetical protein
VRNELLRRVKKERNILRKIKRMKVNWIGHLLSRNYLVKSIIQRKIEMTEVREDEEEEVSSY